MTGNLRPDKPVRIRGEFWDHVDRSGEHWLWQGYVTKAGYGHAQSRFTQRVDMAHRVAYELAMGRVPAGMEVDHLCRVRLCVRPDHLEAVSHAENMRRITERPWALPPKLAI